MPIYGQTPRECFSQFSEHVSELVAQTLGPRPHIAHVYSKGSVVTLSFREQTPVAVPIETERGRLYFYLGQELRAKRERRKGRADRYRLETERYWYRIQEEPNLRAKALLRWEYARNADPDSSPRHHVQARAEVASVANEDLRLDLDRLHTATGYVLMEEIIRFLITDFGLKPACGDQWPEVLEEGRRRFFEDFTTKRHTP